MGSGSNNNKKQTRSRQVKSKDSEKRSVGTIIIACEKGTCMKHTEADLKDFKVVGVENSYLQATRKENGIEGWEKVATNCWSCGGEF